MIAPRKGELLASDLQNPQEAAPLWFDFPSEMKEVKLSESEEHRVDCRHPTSLLSLLWPSRSPVPVEPAFPIVAGDTAKNHPHGELETGHTGTAVPVVSLAQSAVPLECCLVSAATRRL